MYNRYIPQPDGSYRKSRMQEPQRRNPPWHAPSAPKKEGYPPSQSILESEPKGPSDDNFAPVRKESEGILGFFKNLLPRDLDTGDLMIILLLLLISGDCEDDKNTTLLTLALYFFM